MSMKRPRTDSNSTTESSVSAQYPQARKSILRQRRTALPPGSVPPQMSVDTQSTISEDMITSLSGPLASRIQKDVVIIKTILYHLRHIVASHKLGRKTSSSFSSSSPLSREMAKCSLVCRTWRKLSRPHIAPSVLLHQCNKTAFLTLTSSPFCTLPQYIHTLTLMTRISPLCFQDPLKFCTVSTLRIMECTFESMQELGDIICSFRNLHTLELANVEWIDTPPWISFTRSYESLPPKLEKIELYLPSEGLCAELIDWFMSFHQPPPRLHTLKFGGQLGKDDIVSLQILFEVLGDRLKNLFLYNTKLLPLDLSQTPSLETLSLSHILSKSLHRHGPWLSSLSRLSLSPSCGSIKEIKFHLVDGYDMDLQLIDWAALNRILERFQGLQKLGFAGAQGGGKKVVKKELGNWKAKGLLVLSC